MDLKGIFEDKSIKAKAKVAQIGDWLLSGELLAEELLAFAAVQKAVPRATCIEALEYATKKKPETADEQVWVFVSYALKEEEPRIKWESAKVIGNVCSLFRNQLEEPIQNLLANTKKPGTVVRWATAYALAEILKLKTVHNNLLLPTVEALVEKEEDNGVKKKYLDALKKVKK